MEFNGIKWISIDQLGLSQIYLNRSKIEAVKGWFRPLCLDNFQPLPVHDFGNGAYTLTDGHTRAYVTYQRGVSHLPVFYDSDEMVAGPIGQMLYQADLEWCRRFGLSHIGQLGNRILDNLSYQKLWIERCDRSHCLLTAASRDERTRMQKLAPGLFLYGASEDLSTLFFENEAGALFVYQGCSIQPETR